MDTATGQLSLLGAARAFVRKSTAIAIVPLAMVSMATKAKAQFVFQGASGGSITSPTTNFGSIPELFPGAISTGSTAGPTINGINGVTAFGSGTITTGSGGGTANPVFQIFGSTSGPGSLSSGSSIPISFAFTLSKNVGLTAATVNWILSLNLTSSTGGFEQIATGSFSTASQTFTGTGSYFVPTTTLGSSGGNWQFNLAFSYPTTARNDQLGFAMDNATGQGLGINVAAVPEPSTYALFALGLGLVSITVYRRSRRSGA